MPTVLELLTLSDDYLKKKGISSSRLNAELLLADILKCKRLDLYLNYDKPLKTKEIDEYREYIRRRSKFEPLQYIVGNVEFYGYEFFVTKDVLIPRQETESLIEIVIQECKDIAEPVILDIGTGSGNIAITLLHELKNANVVAIDISENALDVARNNAKKHKVGDRIQFLQYDLMTQSNSIDNRFHVIVSNPPYVSNVEYDGLQKEIVGYEPKFAVTDNYDGFSFYKSIAQKAKDYFMDRGKIIVEVGAEQAEDVKKIFAEQNLSDIRSEKDLLGIERVVVATYCK